MSKALLDLRVNTSQVVSPMAMQNQDNICHVHLLLLFSYTICNCKNADGSLDFWRACLSAPARLKLFQSSFNCWAGDAYCGKGSCKNL